MAKVLVLDTHDTHLGGHGWSVSEDLKRRGHEVFFLALHRKNASTENYFYDLRSWWGKMEYFLFYYFRDLIAKKVFLRPESRYSFVSTYLWGKSADAILKKCPFKPDFIQIAWVPGFVTPRAIRELYDRTKATLVLQMVDEAILSVCHYHKDCDGFLDGCKNCPHVNGIKWIPRYVMGQKKKWWTDMPGVIMATSFDADLAKHLPFLNKMSYAPGVAVPICEPVFRKEDARDYFRIGRNDFVVFIGANNVANPDKGYPYTVDALNKMIRQLPEDGKRITLLVLGHNAETLVLDIDDRINVVRRDFLPKEHFFKAYYACDVHVSATLYDSGPMMVNYALACGRPVISFPVGVALDLVKEGETGYIATYKNTDEMAIYLRLLYNMTSDELAIMGDKCKQMLESFKGKSFWDRVGTVSD